MGEIVTNKKLQIPPYAKVKVYWDDKPENYSRDGKNKIKTHFARKYGVQKSNINVVFRPVKIDGGGNKIEIDGAGIDNIMDVNYQRGLFKEWLVREEKDVPFDRILKLDERVNGDLDVDLSQFGHRKYEIKWLMVNNFLCFGEGNYVNFGKLRGLNIINSNPSNQGGKTTFSVDTIKYLFFGKTTKTDTNIGIFNTFSDKNEVVVRGMVRYDDDKDVIIERTMTRKAKRKGGWTVDNKVAYYEIMPDGEEVELEGEHAISTTNEITRVIGSEDDFDTTILTTANNLEDLIYATPTQSGKLLTKFIGLEVIEKKEAIVRKMYNEFAKKMKSNIYDVGTLTSEIEEHTETIELNTKSKVEKEKALDNVKKEIDKLNTDRDNLLVSKKQIDISITQLNPTTIESEIETITKEGLTFKDEIKKCDNEIKKLIGVTYDEVAYFNLSKESNQLEFKLDANITKKKEHEKTLDQLINGEICPTCKRALEDVDHSVEIKQEEQTILNIDKQHAELSKELEIVKGKILAMKENKAKVDQRDQLELKKDRAEVEIKTLRDKIKDKRVDLKKYKDNEEAITHNTNIDAKIDHVKTNIKVKETESEDLIRGIQLLESNILQNETKILDKKKLIKDIGKENEVDRIFKVYIEMIGKKGVSKLVLRSVLPIINSELYRLMEDVIDFSLELNINDKNNLEFIMVKNEVEKPLKTGSGLEKTISSLALRCVLGKMSNLPMPNFITFDEVFGKVADENIDKMKPMFDKIKDMFDIVFLITMREQVKDWGDNIITINKVDDISKVLVK